MSLLFRIVLALLLTSTTLLAREPIAAALQPFVDDHVLAGAVTLVADREKVLSVETVGFADIGKQKGMQPDSVFWIASMSKPITGLAVMILVDEGKVSLDDPVEKYIPEFKGQMVVVEQDGAHVLLKKPKHAITVRNVMAHTSGLPFKTPIEAPTLDILPLSARVRSYAMTPLQFEPDSKYQYSNAGINIGGRIVEVVTGMSFEKFLDERLFQPLGMRDTTFYPQAAQIARLAKAYKPNADKSGLDETPISQLLYPLDSAERTSMPAGGLFSTAADLALLCRMVLNEGELNGKRYLSAAAIKQMATTQTGDLPNSYGVGWSTNRSTGSFGHGGALSTNMQIDPANQLITIFLVQHAGWPKESGKTILPTFQKTALATFGKKPEFIGK